jgi:hypothetical protein
VSKITRRDVIQLIDTIKDRGAVYQAHTILTHCKVFFAWAVEHGHIEASPAALFKPSRLIGAKQLRRLTAVIASPASSRSPAGSITAAG